VLVAGREAPWVAFSRTGRYAARWNMDPAGNGDVLQRLDIETGVRTDLAVDSAGTHTAAIWLVAP